MNDLTLNRDQWLVLLERIANALPSVGDPVRLCLIGSAACLLEAMPNRASRDLDVWQPGSDFDRQELKRAVELAGLLFDPKGELNSELPYVQIVTPGPSQTGSFTPVLWARMGRLHVYFPPWPNLIASKLARGDERDVEDVLFLAGRYRVTAESVAACAEVMPEPARQQVLENLLYLRILKS
jgi:hypothetical protein